MVWEGEGGGDTRILKEGMGESRWKRVARFRLGNEMREGRYWEEEEMQAMWKGGVETWEHVWEECRDWRERGEEG